MSIKPLYELLSKLDELNTCVGDKNQCFKLYPDYLPDLSIDFLKAMLDKLVKEGVLLYEMFPDDRSPFHAVVAAFAAINVPGNHLIFYKIKLTPSFDKYYKKIKTDYIRADNEQKTLSEDIAYQVEYDEMTSQIVCNNFLLSKPQYDSINEIFFRAVYARPNSSINLSDIGLKGKSVHKIIEQLGFSGDLKKIFFKVNKNTVVFHNPVKRSTLKAIKLYPLSILKKGK
jgi:hypothetical protein